MRKRQVNESAAATHRLDDGRLVAGVSREEVLALVLGRLQPLPQRLDARAQLIGHRVVVVRASLKLKQNRFIHRRLS